MMSLIDDLKMSPKIKEDFAALFQDRRSLIDALIPCLKTCRVAEDNAGGVPRLVVEEMLFNGPGLEPRSWVRRPDI